MGINASENLTILIKKMEITFMSGSPTPFYSAPSGSAPLYSVEDAKSFIAGLFEKRITAMNSQGVECKDTQSLLGFLQDPSTSLTHLQIYNLWYKYAGAKFSIDLSALDSRFLLLLSGARGEYEAFSAAQAARDDGADRAAAPASDL